ncbi:MAG: transpeptidase family protein [Bacteroidales bacterium]|jgi:cell division protein FtsI (penicillin-binding protein 3)|nr:transpeptidase family protein [Bacteroidales bacterium]
MDISKELAKRYLLIFILIAAFGVGIVVRVISIQFFSEEGSELREAAKQVNNKKIEPTRGIIYSHDGKELAISVPQYIVYFDYRTIKKDSIFENNKRALADSLARMFAYQGKSKTYYLNLLEKAKKQKKLVRLHDGYIDYDKRNRIKNFPILEYGEFKGGLNIQSFFDRAYPYGEIALRTIGNFKKDVRESEYGLERTFHDELSGKEVLVDSLVKGDKPPHAIDGYDIVTNLDVGIQSIVHEELLKSLQKLKAEWGCAIVMETKTGAILAVSNLSLNPHNAADSNYYETIKNFAVAERKDPGSTIKLPSLMIALADGVIQLDDTIRIRTSNGDYTYRYGGVETHVRDWDWKLQPNMDKRLTVMEAFAHSSNLGVSKVIFDNYVSHKKSEDFYKRLKSMGLDKKTGIDLLGEPEPGIKEFAKWDGGTLIQMSYGYEMALTPLQILTFYNAVANDGKMMKPYLVSQIKNGSEVVKKYKPTVLNASICNTRTLELAKQLLRSVIETDMGTAKAIRSKYYNIAGKTGSAQTYIEKLKSYDGNVIRGSFCGYFPAESPKYTCIVVIQGAQYAMPVGGGTAAHCFRKISDRIYFSDHELRNQMTADTGQFVQIPQTFNGYKRDFAHILTSLGLSNSTLPYGDWIATIVEEDSISYSALHVPNKEDKKTPKLIGMGMRDAVYIAENTGLKVKCTGYGKVVAQSITPGTPTQNYREITLELR